MSQVKSKERVAKYGEVFTSKREVKAMCDLVSEECSRIDSRFLEPACGTGNFLFEILRRILVACKKKQTSYVEYEQLSVRAVMSLYGIELLSDNVKECRKRLYSLWKKFYIKVCKTHPDKTCCKLIKFILTKNIICGNTLSTKQENGQPIVFAEWKFIDSSTVKRQDFRLDSLLEREEKASNSFPAFLSKRYDHQKGVSSPVKEYKPVHYRKLLEEK